MHRIVRAKSVNKKYPVLKSSFKTSNVFSGATLAKKMSVPYTKTRDVDSSFEGETEIFWRLKSCLSYEMMFYEAIGRTASYSGKVVYSYGSGSFLRLIESLISLGRGLLGERALFGILTTWFESRIMIRSFLVIP